MSVKKINEVPAEDVAAGSKTTRQVLISAKEAPNFAMRKFTIQPGGGMPMHTNTVEHEQLILNGKADVVIGEHKFVAQKDDVVFIPAGVPHSYTTIGEAPFEFLCVVPNKEDVIEVIKE